MIGIAMGGISTGPLSEVDIMFRSAPRAPFE